MRSRLKSRGCKRSENDHGVQKVLVSIQNVSFLKFILAKNAWKAVPIIFFTTVSEGKI